MRPIAYLAGPDVFLPNAPEHARRKAEICVRHGLHARPPLNEDIATLAAMPERDAWRAIYAKDVAMMEASDLAIVNLTPFRGASADAGTPVELGWFLGRNRPVFAYSNSAESFTARSATLLDAVPDPMAGLTVGGFGLPDNLMIAGAVEQTGGYPILLPEQGSLPFDSLEVFERCVMIAAAEMLRRRPHQDAGAGTRGAAPGDQGAER
jgi:nucleoside 2-deoxyribosyltransferase